MSPLERLWRDLAVIFRASPRNYPHAAAAELAADLLALESLTLGEVEALQRLCRPDCPDTLAAEGRG